jgi:hypothetical protein
MSLPGSAALLGALEPPPPATLAVAAQPSFSQSAESLTASLAATAAAGAKMKFHAFPAPPAEERREKGARRRKSAAAPADPAGPKKFKFVDCTQVRPSILSTLSWRTHGTPQSNLVPQAKRTHGTSSLGCSSESEVQTLTQDNGRYLSSRRSFS